MAISDTLQELATDISNAYDSIDNKGGTLPSDKNTNNLATAINSIQTGITPTGTINITENGTVDVTNYATADVQVPGVEIEEITITMPSNTTYSTVAKFNTTKGKIPKAFELINTNPDEEGVKRIVMLNGVAYGSVINVANHRSGISGWGLREPPISFVNESPRFSMTVSEVAFTSSQYNCCFLSNNEYQLTCYYWD